MSISGSFHRLYDCRTDSMTAVCIRASSSKWQVPQQSAARPLGTKQKERRRRDCDVFETRRTHRRGGLPAGTESTNMAAQTGNLLGWRHRSVSRSDAPSSPLGKTRPPRAKWSRPSGQWNLRCLFFFFGGLHWNPWCVFLECPPLYTGGQPWAHETHDFLPNTFYYLRFMFIPLNITLQPSGGFQSRYSHSSKRKGATD